MPVVEEFTPEVLQELKKMTRERLDNGEFERINDNFSFYLHFEGYIQLQALKEAVDEYNRDTNSNFIMEAKRTFTEVIDSIIARVEKDLNENPQINIL